MRMILRGAIRVYQLVVSPLLGPSCRFWPSCSEYAREAIAVHGAARGSLLAAKRILRCHPFHPGGVDVVPRPLAAQDLCDMGSCGRKNSA